MPMCQYKVKPTCTKCEDKGWTGHGQDIRLCDCIIGTMLKYPDLPKHRVETIRRQVKERGVRCGTSIS